MESSPEASLNTTNALGILSGIRRLFVSELNAEKNKLMRYLFLFLCMLFFCTSFTNDKPQKKFHEITYKKPKRGIEWINESYVSLENIFKYYTEDTLLSIEITDLQDVECYDFSKLKNVETLNLVLPFDPYVPDSVKKKNIEMTQLLIPGLSAFSKCPRLKRVIFILMDISFVLESDYPDLITHSDFVDPHYKHLWRMQMKVAWDSFGYTVPVMLPGVKLYAFDGDW